jgi:hypothetical protein
MITVATVEKDELEGAKKNSGRSVMKLMLHARWEIKG